MSNAQHYYIEHLTRLGDQHAIVTSEDIYSEHGMKLLTKGQRVDSGKLALLARHKLRASIDRSVSMDVAVDRDTLEEAADAVTRDAAPGSELLALLNDPEILKRSFHHIFLCAEMSNKLAVLRYQTPKLFEHSIAGTLLATLLGEAIGLDDAQLTTVASAALLHDIGELYVDPTVFTPRQDLNATQWRQMYAHPIIGSVLLEESGHYPTSVARAVREHHERLDGSGYPRGSRDPEQSIPGRIIAFVEFILGVAQHHDLNYLDVILRSYSHRFHRPAVNAFLEFIRSHRPQQSTPASAHHPEQQRLRLEMEAISARVCHWHNLCMELPSCRISGSQESFIDEELFRIEQTLIRAGINMCDASSLKNLWSDDPQTLQELDTLLHEARYQLRRLVRAVDERWPNLAERTQDDLANHWLQQTRHLLNNDPATEAPEPHH